MFITKFDLYKDGWLDLVFSNRNKGYGAYELRQHYASTMLKAMGITFFAVGAAITGYIVLAGPVPVEAVPDMRETIVKLTRVVEPPKPKEAIVLLAKKAAAKPAAPATEAPARSTAIPTQVSESEIVDPPVIDKITGTIGTVNRSGDDKTNNATPGGGTDPKGMGTGEGGGLGAGESNELFITVERMPEPVGGSQAWSKFIQKNLRYPAVEQEQGLSGMVIVSFTIEKDGRLTDFKILRKAGTGFDEEALRVLKLSPPWKPGIQNGRAVRVKYTIPFNFRLPE